MLTASSMAFAAYWHDATLRRDFGALVNAGHVAAEAEKAGASTPAGWFSEASKTYGPYSASDRQGQLGQRACALVAAAFAAGVPS